MHYSSTYRPGLDSALTLHSPCTHHAHTMSMSMYVPAGPRLCTHHALTLHISCSHVLLVNIQAGPRLRTRDPGGDAVRRGRGARASRPAEADRGTSLPPTTLLLSYLLLAPRDDSPRRLCPEPPLLSTPQPSVLQPHPRPHPSPQTPSPSPQTEAFQAPAHSPRPPPSPPSAPCYPMAPHAIQVTTLIHITYTYMYMHIHKEERPHAHK